MESVVLCEKPSQARNLQAAVGGRFGDILSARGHLLELAEPGQVNPEWKRWSSALLHPGKPYPLRPRKGVRETLQRILAALKSANRAIIATDCDREGHLIGMKLIEYARFKGEVLRAIFNAEDPQSIRKAFAELRPASDLDGLHCAGKARQQADQICNLTLTRTATVHLLGPGKGAIGVGRVRTPTLAIVCRREREIQDFKPEMRYVVLAKTHTAMGEFTAACRKLPGGAHITARENAAEIAAAAPSWSGALAADKTLKSQSPPMPFDLSSLQQEMGRRRKWTAARTLEVAQSLYADLKLITYPRAECRAWPETMAADAEELRQAAAALIGSAAGKAVIRQGRGRSCAFSDHKLAGSSHHAIAPNIATAGQWEAIWSRASDDQKALAGTVMRRFLASTDSDWIFDRLTLSFKVPMSAGSAGPAEFSATGNSTVSAGWTRWERAKAEPAKGDAEPAQKLPQLEDGTAARCTGAAIAERPTRPPGRYSEGGIIAAMRDAWKFLPEGAERERLREASGIGTPATRDRVIETLVRQGQLNRKDGCFEPTQAGYALWQCLEERAPSITDPGLTAIWENRLDEIERKGGGGWMQTVDEIAAEAGRAGQAILQTGAGGLAELDRGRAAGKPGRRRAGGARNGKGAPSEKQLALLAKLVEARGGEDATKPVVTAAEASALIEKLLGQAKPQPPTPKALAYARHIAESRGIDLPETCVTDRRTCSEFIDQNK